MKRVVFVILFLFFEACSSNKYFSQTTEARTNREFQKQYGGKVNEIQKSYSQEKSWIFTTSNDIDGLMNYGTYYYKTADNNVTESNFNKFQTINNYDLDKEAVQVSRSFENTRMIKRQKINQEQMADMSQNSTLSNNSNLYAMYNPKYNDKNYGFYQNSEYISFNDIDPNSEIPFILDDSGRKKYLLDVGNDRLQKNMDFLINKREDNIKKRKKLYRKSLINQMNDDKDGGIIDGIVSKIKGLFN